jgi:hypothetical protein
VRRQQILCVLIGFFIVASLWELVLAAQDDQFADGICAALGLASLPADTRAIRLFHWVSRYDDNVPSTPPAGKRRGLLTPRGIVEQPGYYREDCGAKVWLLGFLAERAGLKARELRLCDAGHYAHHVVSEMWVGGRWTVFDPMVDLDFRRRDGRPATAAELADPALLAANAVRVPAYDLRRWRFDHPERLHFEKIPWVGSRLRWLASRFTGRPAEELSIPSILERPRLIAAGGLVLLAGLALIALGHSARRVRQKRLRQARDPLPGHALALQSTDQD